MIDPEDGLQAQLLQAAMPFLADGETVVDLGTTDGTTSLLPASHDVVAVLDLHRPGTEPIGRIRSALRILKAGGRVIVAGRVDADGGYSCSAEGMEALLKLLGFSKTLAVRPDLCGGRAYLVAAQK